MINTLYLFVNEAQGFLSLLCIKIHDSRFEEAARIAQTLRGWCAELQFNDLSMKLEHWESKLSNGQIPSYFENACADLTVEFNGKIRVMKKMKEYRLLTKALHEKNVETKFPGKRVLVMDDHGVNAVMLRSFFKELDCKVINTTNAVQTMEQSLAKRPDLILLDLQFPANRQALNVITGLRKAGINVPIILLSPAEYIFDREESLLAGATDFIPKPAKRSRLRHILIRHLNN